MSRRPVPEEEYRSESPMRRYVRKKGGNEGLWIALGVAGLVAVVLVLVLSGGAGLEEQKPEALAAMKKLFLTCLENRESDGVLLVDPREVLREDNKEEIKRWRELSPARQLELGRQAWRDIKGKVLSDLKITSSADIDTILGAADVSSGIERLYFTWTLGEDVWRAVMSNRTGSWVLLRLDRRTPGSF